MRVRLDWYEPGSDTPIRTERVEVEETGRLLRVKLPSGYIARVKKFPRGADLTRPLSHTYSYGATTGRRVVITWDPTEYQVK